MMLLKYIRQRMNLQRRHLGALSQRETDWTNRALQRVEHRILPPPQPQFVPSHFRYSRRIPFQPIMPIGDIRIDVPIEPMANELIF